MRYCARILLALWFIVGGVFLFAREVAAPHIGDYREEIAAAASRAMGLPVTIDALSADWPGLRPRLHLRGVTVRDGEGRPALELARVDATLSLKSLLLRTPHFHRLDVYSPALALRRERDGGLVAAGLRIAAGPDGGGFLEWVLAQQQIAIHGAALTWNDDYRAAPELRLEQVDFLLDRGFRAHRFALRAQPPENLASALDLRGELARLSSPNPLHSKGKLYVDLKHADLGGWLPWVDYPLPLKGDGGVRMWLDLDGAAQTAVTADVALEAVSARLGENLPELGLSRLHGRVAASRSDREITLTAQGLRLATVDGVALPATDFTLRWQGVDKEEGRAENRTEERAGGGELRANQLDLAVLTRLAAYLPLGDETRARLAGSGLRGQVSALRFSWEGEMAALRRWKLAARLREVGFEAYEALPGLGGLSGEIDGDEGGGRFRLSGAGAHIDLPQVFEQSRLTFSSLRAQGGWSRADGRLRVTLDTASFENPDAAGDASGSYWPESGVLGEIDMQARLTRAESGSVWRYLPRVVGRETNDWVRTAIRRADVPETRLRLRGRLDDFPFRDGSGQFLVAIKVADAVLDYAPGWPSIEGLYGEVRFEGPGLRIDSSRARIFGVALTGVNASVPDLDADGGPVMSITGKANGPTGEFLRFVSQSPVAGRIGHFTEGMRAEGSGALELRLAMPLAALDRTRVSGAYRFAANRLWLAEGMPPLEEAGGRLHFTADELTIPEARARLYGEPLQLSAATSADGGVLFSASGTLPVSVLRRDYDSPALAHLGGAAAWQAEVAVRGKEGVHVSVRSSLEGVTSSFPFPFGKNAAERWPLLIEMDYPDSSRRTLRARLAERLQAEIEYAAIPSGWQIKRGGIGLFQTPRMVDGGVMAAAEFDDIDLDAWRRALADDVRVGEQADAGGEAPQASGGFALAGVTLQAHRLRLLGQTLNGVALRAVADAGGWKARLDSDRAKGEFDWRHAGDGTLVARLEHLDVGGDDGHEKEAGNSEETPVRRLPGLDVAAEKFTLRGLDLGRLEVSARNHDGAWRLDRLLLENPDGRLAGNGEWQSVGEERSRLAFRLETANIGRFMHRFGYPDAVRGGQATLTGDLAWHGAPTRIDYPTLGGAMRFDAGSGQFRKLDPGMGRLLGVLSLQALPRRITLDFRDIFSEGFAFDRIAGDATVAQGVMSTGNLEITGAAARIQMRGTVDVSAETQDLRVTVQPTLSESVAIGAAAGLINPVAGVVTYLAQKALSDPVERLFAFEYAITGGWDDPQVVKLGSGANNPASAPPGDGGDAGGQ